MKCPHCAEEIRDDAVLCRFCSAIKEKGTWRHPSVKPATKPFSLFDPRFTIRTAAVFFMASACIELFSLASGVPLFGQVHSGLTAVVYHLLFVGLYLGMGIGLWNARPWGLQFMFGCTVFYTLDKLQHTMFYDSMAASGSGSIHELEALIGADGMSIVTQATYLGTAFTLACWWGFLGYLYFKRDYFVK